MHQSGKRFRGGKWVAPIDTPSHTRAISEGMPRLGERACRRSATITLAAVAPNASTRATHFTQIVDPMSTPCRAIRRMAAAYSVSGRPP